MFVVALFASAFAQDSLDAHGFALAPNDGDPFDYLATWRPEAQVKGSFGFNGLFEYADSPLVLVHQASDGTQTEETLVDNLFGLNLGATYGLVDRIGIAASMPVWFTSVGPEGAEGPTVGDLRVAIPVSIVLPDEETGGFGLSVVPFVDAPTGADRRFLGNNTFGGGATLAAGFRTSAFTIDGNIGAAFADGIEYENLRGGTKLLTGLGIGYAITEVVALRAEGVFRPSLSQNRVAGTESPGEILISARGRHNSGLTWTLGGAFPFTYGASAAKFRVFAGLGWQFGKQKEPDTDLDGLVDSLDACPTQAEIVNGYLDTDGCPDELADIVVTVKNEDGAIVADADVTLGGKVYHTDTNGQARVDDVMPEQTLTGGAVAHPFYSPATVADFAPKQGLNEQTVVVAYLPGKVRVITKSETGAIIDATVTFQGPAPKAPAAVGDDGQEVFELRPGSWRLLVSAEAFGTERRELTIHPGETSLVVIEVVMKPAKTVIKATEIRILEQVQFDFDKDTIKAESFPLLTEVANILLEHPEIRRLEVQGHTDNKGNDGYNKDLSQRRVNSVVTFLVGQGVDVGRLVPVGYGEEKPIADNKTEKGRALNRRVQFVILDGVASNPAGNQIETPVPDGATRPTP